MLHHLKAFAPDPCNTILLTGYQAGGTRGARIAEGAKEIKMLGEVVPVQAEVVSLHNASAHVDYEEMITWLQRSNQTHRQVFITHGEKEAALAVKAQIEKRLHWKCHIPTYLDDVELP